MIWAFLSFSQKYFVVFDIQVLHKLNKILPKYFMCFGANKNGSSPSFIAINILLIDYLICFRWFCLAFCFFQLRTQCLVTMVSVSKDCLFLSGPHVFLLCSWPILGWDTPMQCQIGIVVVTVLVVFRFLFVSSFTSWGKKHM